MSRPLPQRLVKPTLLVLALAGSGCFLNPGCKKAEALPPAVILADGNNQPVRVRVEIADAPDTRERGLMYRQALAPDAGMLFVYPQEVEASFWMRNTFLPLDMIFISENRRVLGSVENAKPLSTDHVGIDAPSRFVLEVNAGFVQRHGIRAGSPVRFEGIDENPGS
jgi:uncharacterized protein